MDQNKLVRAFEKNRAERIPKHQGTQDIRLRTLSDVGPRHGVGKVLQVTPGTLLSDMRNPRPMTSHDMKAKGLVYAGMKHRAVLNAYRELRIKLLDQSETQNLSVMISSADTADNGITTALNLAICFSLEVHSSALLIDCNPYRSNLPQLVTAPLTLGITDFLMTAGVGLDEIIYPSGIERVNVIPAGNSPSAAVELFSSHAMQNLIYELKNRYSDRVIVINAPPVLASSEARVLARYCDQCVLMVPYGQSDMATIEDAITALGSTNLSGLVYRQ